MCSVSGTEPLLTAKVLRCDTGRMSSHTLWSGIIVMHWKRGSMTGTDRQGDAPYISHTTDRATAICLTQSGTSRACLLINVLFHHCVSLTLYPLTFCPSAHLSLLISLSFFPPFHTLQFSSCLLFSSLTLCVSLTQFLPASSSLYSLHTCHPRTCQHLCKILCEP